jgi:hypothetical protein
MAIIEKLNEVLRETPMLRAFRASSTLAISHWSQLIKDLSVPPTKFYEKVEQAIANWRIPDATVSRVAWKEGGIFSASREYLRIERQKFLFDICGAPFGEGFFVSWWFAEVPSLFWRLVAAIPIVGGLIVELLKPETYYKLDTEEMFQKAVHDAVLQVVDDLCCAKNLRPLTDSERAPKMREFFNR